MYRLRPLNPTWLLGLAVPSLLLYPLPVAWLAAILVPLAAACRWRAQGRPFAETPFGPGLALYLLGALIGLVGTLDPAEAGVRLTGLLAAIAAHLALADVSRRSGVVAPLLAISLLATLACLPGLLFASLPGMDANRYPSVVWEALAPMLPQALDLRRALRDGLPELSQRLRLTPSGVGTLSAWGIALGLSLALAAPARRYRVAAGVGIVVALLALLLTASRGSLLAAALLLVGVPALAAATAAHGRAIWPVLAVPLAAAVLAVAAFQTGRLPDLVGSAAGNSLAQRFEIWRLGLYGLGDLPYAGAGLGLTTAAAVYSVYAPAMLQPVPHLHNAYLQSYFEQGLAGFAGLALLTLQGLVVTVQALRRRPAPPARMLALAGGGGFFAFAIVGLTEIGMLTSVGMVLAFGSLGLLAAAANPVGAAGHVDAPKRDGHPWRRSLLYAGAGVALLLVAPALLDLAAGVRRGPAAPGEALGGLVARVQLERGTRALLRLTLARGLDRPAREALAGATLARLEAARQLDRNGTRPLLELARLALIRDQPGQAVELLQQAEQRALDGDDNTLFQIGRLYQRSGEVERALAVWGRVDAEFGLQTVVGPTARYLEWSNELLQSGKPELAARVSLAAIERAPTLQEPYRTLSRALQNGGQSERAATVLMELAERYPDVPWPCAELVTIYRRSQDRAALVYWATRLQEVWDSAAWRQRQAAALAAGTGNLRGLGVSR